MKKAWLVAVAFLVAVPFGLWAQSDTPSDGYYAASFVRLTYASGDVFVQRASDLGTERGEVNLALVQGDKLGTGTGRAEVDFGHRNFLRLDNNSKVEFAILPTDGDNRIKIHVLEGRVYLRISTLADEKSVEVHSPDVSCYVLDEGLYRINVGLNGQTEVSATEGSIEAAGEEGSVVLHARESLAAADGRLLGDPERSYSGPDDFDQWNGSRDSLFAQRSATRYLPSDIDEYQEELDQNGRWTYEQPYGYVWVPYGIDDDWRPYMYGRWCWYAGLGWNWISSEPWGWSVYHYGRWHWRFGLGWYWIPQNHWGPAWVHWWWDNNYLGWCPLSWYNRPVVISNNRFYDRYSEHYFPGNNRAMSVIRRDQLQSRDLGRHLLSAGELAGLDRVALRAGQPDFRPAVGRSNFQSPAAQKIFSARPGIRNEVKNYSPGTSVSASRLRQGNAGFTARSSGVSPSAEVRSVRPGRSPANGSGASSGMSSERSIRVYPRGESSSSSRQESAVRSASERTVRSPRATGSGSLGSPARVYPSRRETPFSSTAETPRTYPSRLTQENIAGLRSARSYANGSSRQSYSQDGAARSPLGWQRSNPGSVRSPSYSGYSRSYSAPSRSSSYGQAPRYNPRTYSYSRPSAPRSYAPSRSVRSSGRSSSSSRSSASSRSRGSSSSRSSSSGHSGSVWRKG